MLCKTTALISKVSIHSDTLFETHSENKKKSSGDEIPERDIALLCYPSGV